WATIAGERLDGPPDESRRPERSPDDHLVDTFLAGARRLADVLRDADQRAACWTWAPLQQDVAFVTRHQVQEAAVHHWDAVDATGGSLAIEPAVAADAVSEFLTFSVSTDADAAEPERPSLRGSFVLHALDTDETWTVSDGDAPGTTRFTTDSEAATVAPRFSATASDLVLWLYGRVDLDTSPVPADVLARFRGLCFTD
ncbi:MAG: maleylpyruvate isomerase N-terminal domain-containing protein, partial [Nocardioidaceae bacterium]